MYEGGGLLYKIFLTVIAVLVIAILVGCVYALFSAIFYFIFSGGDTDRKKLGFNSLRYMVIGLLVTVFLLFVVPFFFRFLGLPGAELLNFTNVMTRVREILSLLWGVGELWGGYVSETTSLGDGDAYYGGRQL